MTTAAIISALNTAIKDNSLALTDDIPGISWSTDLPTAIETYFKLTELSISSPNLKAIDAPSGAVEVDQKDVPSVMITGQLVGSDPLLGVPAEDITLSLFATPNADDSVDFTIVVQFENKGPKGVVGWRPADSFPGLADQFVFKALIADKEPSFLLSSFAHNQSWNFQDQNAPNTFSNVQENLNLQVPAGISTETFPPLAALFGSENLAQLYFNGTVDNANTDTDDKDMSISLLADMVDDKYNKKLTGFSDFTLKFFLGFEAAKVTTADPAGGDDGSGTHEAEGDTGMTALQSDVVLQTQIGSAIVKATIPLKGSTISFSMEGIDDHPAFNVREIAQLFDSNFITDYLPPSIKDGGQNGTDKMAMPKAGETTTTEDILDNLGVYNLGLVLHIPSTEQESKKEEESKKEDNADTDSKGEGNDGGSDDGNDGDSGDGNDGNGGDDNIKILSTMLKAGYKGKGIGYDNWFSLDEFFITYTVQNPFTPKQDPKVMLNGDFELLSGEISFEADFAKKEAEEDSSDTADDKSETPEENTETPKDKSEESQDTSDEETTENPTSDWVFTLEGGLVDDSNKTIDLSMILGRYNSDSSDFSRKKIDAFTFSAAPAEQTYELSLELVSDPPAPIFQNFSKPEFNSLSLDIKKEKEEIEGSIDLVFSFPSSIKKEQDSEGETDSTIVFELSAERTEENWKFEGQNKDAFTLSDLTAAFGIENTPDYLNEVTINQVDVSYIAPIQPKAGTEDGDKPDGQDGSEEENTNEDSTKQEGKNDLDGQGEDNTDNGEDGNGDSEDGEDGNGDSGDGGDGNGDKKPKPSVFEVKLDTTFGIVNEELEVKLDFTKKKTSWDLEGTIIIGPKPENGSADDPPEGLEFGFSIKSSTDKDKKDTVLKADLKGTNKSLNISDFATALGLTPPKLPEKLNDIELKSATFEYETDSKNGKSFLFSADSETYGKIIVVVVKTGEEGAIWRPFFGIGLGPELNFNKLPVVGNIISKFGTLSIENISLAGIPKPLTKKDIAAMSKLLGEADYTSYPQLPKAEEDGTLPAELIFNATIDLNGSKKPIDPIIIPLKGNQQQQTGGEGEETELAALTILAKTDEEGGQPAESSDIGNSSNNKVGKSFGPATIDKFNLSYADGHISIDINGSLTLAAMEMSFEGLGIKLAIPPENPSDVSFQLHGLGIDLQKGNLKIAGGFIAAGPENDPYSNLMGMVAITAGTIGLQAYGGYSSAQESFFIFLHLEMPIGGPPFFFVDGLSGGFGINRDFILPNFEQLGTYPLLPSAQNNPLPSGPPTPPGQSKPGLEDITKALLDLAKFIPPKEGAYWVAAGLDFTSFELLQVSAILEVSFGKDFQIALLGNASMTIPDPEGPAEPIAYISINFEVMFQPSKGILGALGVITPASFIFSSGCQLTGGFAFYNWFKGSEHEGDFVVTIGGYHPDFNKPDWYPSVPRLELKWNLGALHIDGQTFFALTPHVLMAGLDISATWSGGPVKAWFDMGIDFILGWKPFFYEAEAYIHLGASIHLLFTIKVHIGADITIWGPEFGGKAKIDLSIFSFTIHFGSSGPTPPPIPWSNFKKLLPNTHPGSSTQEQSEFAVMAEGAKPQKFAVSTVTLAEGLLKEMSKDPLSQDSLKDARVFNWLLNPNHFEIFISAGVPSNNFTFNNKVNARNDRRKSDTQKDHEGAGKDGSGTTDKGELVLTPPTGTGEYVLPSDLESYYHNSKYHDPFYPETIFAYDYDGLEECEYWWKQPIGVAPVDIAAKDFTSTLVIYLYDVSNPAEFDPDDPKLLENVVLTVVSNNVASSLWGELVNPGNGNGALNQPATIKNALGGMTISAKLYNPLKTRFIVLYNLLFQKGNDVMWDSIKTPVIGPNPFDQTETAAGDTMTFKDNKGSIVTSEYRVLDTGAFADLQQGESIIEELNNAFGLSDDDALVVNTNATDMAEPRYRAWPKLVLLGEEDSNADNE